MLRVFVILLALIAAPGCALFQPQAPRAAVQFENDLAQAFALHGQRSRQVAGVQRVILLAETAGVLKGRDFENAAAFSSGARKRLEDARAALIRGDVQAADGLMSLTRMLLEAVRELGALGEFAPLLEAALALNNDNLIPPETP